MKKTYTYLLANCLIFMLTLGGCSEQKDDGTNQTRSFSLVIPLTVDQGEVTKGVDEEARPEANYPLSEVYIWIGSSGNWQTLSIPFQDGNLKMNIRENENGTITIFDNDKFITFKTTDEVRFVSLPDEIISLPNSTLTTPGGKNTYSAIGDVVFVSSLTNYKYSTSVHSFLSGRTNISTAGLIMNRYSSVIYVKLLVTSFDDPIDNANGGKTYSITPEQWEELLGSPYQGWKVTGFLTDYTYEYNLDTRTNISSKKGVFALGNNFVGLKEMAMVDKATEYYGFGETTSDYRFLFPTMDACLPCITFFDPLMGYATAVLDDTPIAFGRNTTTIYEFIFDYNEVYYSWPMAYSMKSDMNESRIKPKKVYRNKELILDNE